MDQKLNSEIIVRECSKSMSPLIKCPVGGCSLKFLDPSDVGVHYQTHSKLYLCGKCKAKFVTKNDVFEHFDRQHQKK